MLGVDHQHGTGRTHEHRVFDQIDAIGVDEIQYSKRHKYLTLVYKIDLGVTRLLWIGKERTVESFQGFFTTMGEEITSKIVFICSDMWEPYLSDKNRMLLGTIRDAEPKSLAELAELTG